MHIHVILLSLLGILSKSGKMSELRCLKFCFRNDRERSRRRIGGACNFVGKVRYVSSFFVSVNLIFTFSNPWWTNGVMRMVEI